MKLVSDLHPKPKCADIVKTLRCQADKIEAGDYGVITQAVVCLETKEDVEVFVAGEGDSQTVWKNAIFVLTRALHRLGDQKKSEVISGD